MWVFSTRVPHSQCGGAACSPARHGNFPTTPTVYHAPYEFSSPYVEEDYLMQDRKVEGTTSRLGGATLPKTIVVLRSSAYTGTLSTLYR